MNPSFFFYVREKHAEILYLSLWATGELIQTDNETDVSDFWFYESRRGLTMQLSNSQNRKDFRVSHLHVGKQVSQFIINFSN